MAALVDDAAAPAPARLDMASLRAKVQASHDIVKDLTAALQTAKKELEANTQVRVGVCACEVGFRVDLPIPRSLNPSPTLPPRTQAYNQALAEADDGTHYTFDGKGAPVLTPTITDVLQAQGITPEVANATVKLICGILTKGCGEKVYANGCRIAVVDEPGRLLKRLTKGNQCDQPTVPAELGNPPWFNKYGGDHKPNVVDPDGAAMRFFQPDFVATGGFIGVDGQTGDVVVSRAVVRERGRAPAGTYDGVEIASLDDREALVMAARGRCLAMTCPVENCEISGASGGAFRLFYQAGGGAVAAETSTTPPSLLSFRSNSGHFTDIELAGVRVLEIPTKGVLGMGGGGGGGGLGAGGGAAAAEEETEEPRAKPYTFERERGAGHVRCRSGSAVQYTDSRLPPCFDVEIELEVVENGYWVTKTYTGRDVLNATAKLMSWLARVGVPVHVAGRESYFEAAKGALLIVADGEHVWKYCERPKYNKYDHMNELKHWQTGKPISVNVLTIFEYRNEEALRQLALDFLTDGAMVVDIRTGNVIASGVTVLNLSHGSRNGGKKTQAASSAARGDGMDVATYSVTLKLSEDDCDVDLNPHLLKYLQIFNGMMGDAETGIVEAMKVPIRDPEAPVVADIEFMQLAQDGHVLGVKAFLANENNPERVDEPRDEFVSGRLVWWCVGGGLKRRRGW